MHRAKALITHAHLVLLIVATGALLAAQLWVDNSLVDAIATSNYFSLALCSAIFALVALSCYTSEFRFTVSDLLLILLAIFATLHSRNGWHTQEVVMTLCYTSLYLSLRIVNAKFPDFFKYAAIPLLLMGIYESTVVMGQALGIDSANHARFLVSGTFFNPGPCGIFLGGVLVVALTLIKRLGGAKKRNKLDSGLYYLAHLTLVLCFVAIVPTLSRAGWVGAVVGVAFLYHKECLRVLRKICKKCKLNTRVLIVLGSVVVLLGMGWMYMLKEDSANGRLFMWRNTIAATANSPLIGVGAGNFAEHYADAQRGYFVQNSALESDEDPNIYVAGVPQYPFNELLALFLALGTIGVTVMLFVLYRRVFRANNPYAAVVIGLLVAALFSYPFYVPMIGIVFVFALSCGSAERTLRVNGILQFIITVTPTLLLWLSLGSVHRDYEARREWGEISTFYRMSNYEMVVEDSPSLLPELHDNATFMFEYGHSLNKIGAYELSNEVLLEGAKASTDPMFWNIVGNNHLALGEYDKSARAYLRAYYLCPNRIYPLYLLTKLYHQRGDAEMATHYGKILLGKRIKIQSPAVDDMRGEVQDILRDLDK